MKTVAEVIGISRSNLVERAGWLALHAGIRVVSAVDGNDLAHVPEGQLEERKMHEDGRHVVRLTAWQRRLGSRTSTWGGSLLQIGWMFIRLAIRCGVNRGGMLEESDLATTSLPVLRY
jgi:hypothetical protein